MSHSIGPLLSVHLDTDKCQGHGRCYTLCPEVFDADEEGNAVLLMTEVPPSLEHGARIAVANCPEGALRATDIGPHPTDR